MTGQAAAFFDVDGTLVAGNIVTYGVALRTAEMSRLGRWLWILAFLPRVPVYLALDAVSRPAFQRAFYRLYRGIPPAALEARVDRLFEEHVAPRIRAEAEARVNDHRRRGDRIVLVTGSITPIVTPLAERLGADAVLAPGLEERDGAFTGALARPPIAGPAKAAALTEWARDAAVDLERSSAYGDSLDDVPMLERVGHAAVVNPGRRLKRLARARGWEILEWGVAARR